MNDVFIEQLVTRGRTAKQFALAALYTMGMLTVVTLGGSLLPQIVLFLLAGGIWLVWFLVKYQYTEFEYILTNGELDADKITGRTKRRRQVTLDAKGAEIFKPYSEQETARFREQQLAKTVDARAFDGEHWFIVAPSKQGGRVMLIFTPDERLKAGILACNRRLSY